MQPPAAHPRPDTGDTTSRPTSGLTETPRLEGCDLDRYRWTIITTWITAKQPSSRCVTRMPGPQGLPLCFAGYALVRPRPRIKSRILGSDFDSWFIRP